MPDLGLIKQAEQGRGTGVGGFRRGGRATPPAGRAAAATTSPALPGCCPPATQRHCGNPAALPGLGGSIASPWVKPAGRNDPVGRSQKGLILTIVFQA